MGAQKLSLTTRTAKSGAASASLQPHRFWQPVTQNIRSQRKIWRNTVSGIAKVRL
jgi:hypothetical protein